MGETPTPTPKLEPVGPDKPESVVTPPSLAEAFRTSLSRGTSAIIPSNSLYNEGLTEGIIEEIKRQKTLGDYRTISGRPWWMSTYPAEELKKAGLI